MSARGEVHLDDLHQHLGETFGPDLWITIDQKLIDEFATATGDHAWYHTDIARARMEMPGGLTIAHGLLTLALTPSILNDVLHIRFSTRAVNYGYDRVRYPVPVKVGARVRSRVTVRSIDPHPSGTLIRLEIALEVEGSPRPGLVATQLILALA